MFKQRDKDDDLLKVQGDGKYEKAFLAAYKRLSFWSSLLFTAAGGLFIGNFSVITSRLLSSIGKNSRNNHFISAAEGNKLIAEYKTKNPEADSKMLDSAIHDIQHQSLVNALTPKQPLFTRSEAIAFSTVMALGAGCLYLSNVMEAKKDALGNARLARLNARLASDITGKSENSGAEKNMDWQERTAKSEEEFYALAR